MYFCPNCNNVFNITKISNQSGGKSTDDISALVTKLLNNEHIDDTNISFEDIAQTTAYKKLKPKQKEFVHNKIQDIIGSNKEKLLEEKPVYNLEKVYFICTNCGYKKPIEKGTLIFSKVSSEISQTYSPIEVDTMKYSDILPRTRKYICPNKNCESHDNLEKREAVFFRMNNTFRVKYICQACSTAF